MRWQRDADVRRKRRPRGALDFDAWLLALVQGLAVPFDGGMNMSDAGGLLLGSTDRARGLIDRFAQRFEKHRYADRILLSKRVPQACSFRSRASDMIATLE